MSASPAFIVLLIALVFIVGSAAKKLPLWPAVLLLALAVILMLRDFRA